MKVKCQVGLDGQVMTVEEMREHLGPERRRKMFKTYLNAMFNCFRDEGWVIEFSDDKATSK